MVIFVTIIITDSFCCKILRSLKPQM